jgi:hypothetical protein
MSLICYSGRSRISFVERSIMRVFKVKAFRNVLISLKLNGVLNNFDSNIDHRCNFSNNIFAHGFGSITVPFISLSIFYDTWLSFIDDFSLIDGLLKHFIGIIFDLLGGSFDNFFLGFLDDIFVGPKIRRKIKAPSDIKTEERQIINSY